MLWAWETAEDLTGLDTHQVGVAFLARQLLVGSQVKVRPRYQPLRVPPGTWLIAVVRVEVPPHTAPGKDEVMPTAQAIVEAARLPNVRALQVDFDAVASQRAFYANVLRDVRMALPSGFPLSMTALVSWCGRDSWLNGLPVNEAVPMFFRMGGPASTRATAPRSQAAIIEPLCSGAAGLATDEAWPELRPAQRVYLFRPGSWTKNEIAQVNKFGYRGLRGIISP